MRDLSKLTRKELDAYASSILRNSENKNTKSNRSKKRDSRPLVNGKRRRLSRKQKHV